MRERLNCILEKLRSLVAGLRELWADKVRRKSIIVVSSVILGVVVVFLACAIYLGDYYRADVAASDFAPMQSVSIDDSADGMIAVGDADSDVGLIFYPGGKVEYTAYLPLMAACAERGIFCVVVRMPFNLAVLDVNAADGIREIYPEVERWYIGGHSLGGSMAASYVEKNSDDFCGLVLLGSYSTADLSSLGVSVLSLYGSEDGVMNREKYEKYKANLPSDLTEVVLEGANHAGFGMYGAQAGDGEATLSQAEQILWTADLIRDFAFEGER